MDVSEMCESESGDNNGRENGGTSCVDITRSVMRVASCEKEEIFARG